MLNTRDVTDRRELENQLVHEAFHDSLTGLANRALFKDRVEQALKRRDWERSHVAVLFLDLDGFKEVNDSQGHAAGDALLINVAQRLRDSVRPEDTVARLGGDEFAVLIDTAAPDEQVEATAVTERILERLKEAFVIENRELFVRVSIGIATAGMDAENAGSVDAQRRPRHVPGEEHGRRRFRRLSRGHAHGPGRSVAAGGGSAARPRGTSIRAVLPAVDRPRQRHRRRLRGADPMEPPDARAGPARRVHPRRRSERVHPPTRRVGAA